MRRPFLFTFLTFLTACSSSYPEGETNESVFADDDAEVADGVEVDSGLGDTASTDDTTGQDAARDTTTTSPDTAPVDTGTAVDTKPAETSAASAACVSYCGCMGSTCSKYSGYPYPDEKTCLAKCASFSAAQLKCFSFFCADAKKTTISASTREHDCRHAWGTWGLEECP